MTLLWILMGIVLGACALLMLVAGLRMRRIAPPRRMTSQAINAR